MRKHAWWLAFAVLLLAGTAEAQGVSVAQATDEQVEMARGPYLEGKTAFDAGDFAAALPRFQASYDAVASPNSHLMIAKCLMGLGRLADAYRETKAAVAEAEAAAKEVPKYEQTAADARTQLEELRGQIGFVSVRVLGNTGPEATLTVGGEAVPVASADEPVPVSPGPVTVVLESAQGRVERAVAVAAGGNALVEIPTTPDPVPTPGGDEDDEGFTFGPTRTLGMIVGGVGLAGMVNFAIFGSMASSAFSDLEDRCPDKRCDPALAGDADDGQTFQALANVSLVIGLVGLAGGTTLFLLGPEIDGEREGEDSASLRLGVGPGSLQLGGRF